jgi:hypothetical protein
MEAEADTVPSETEVAVSSTVPRVAALAGEV